MRDRQKERELYYGVLVPQACNTRDRQTRIALYHQMDRDRFVLIVVCTVSQLSQFPRTSSEEIRNRRTGEVNECERDRRGEYEGWRNRPTVDRTPRPTRVTFHGD